MRAKRIKGPPRQLNCHRCGKKAKTLTSTEALRVAKNPHRFVTFCKFCSIIVMVRKERENEFRS